MKKLFSKKGNEFGAIFVLTIIACLIWSLVYLDELDNKKKESEASAFCNETNSSFKYLELGTEDYYIKCNDTIIRTTRYCQSRYCKFIEVD